MIKLALSIALLAAQADRPQYSSLPVHSSPFEALRVNQDKWNAAKAQNYEFRFAWYCFCAVLTEPVVITVREGKITSIRYARFESPLPSELMSKYKTVDGLFALLRDNPYQLRMTFHADQGFPTLAFSGDWENPTDGEIGFSISELKITRP